MENNIKLVQKPVIEHELKKAGEKVRQRISELDLENQIATIESHKFLKQTRTELNKEFGVFEEDRKTIKNAVLNPYNEFDALYKTEISEEYKKADEILKTKIDSIEMKIKEEKESKLKVYFIELCQSENIDFITFDKLGLKIDLSTTEKKYKEQINTFMQKVCSDVDLIKMEEFEPEIMVEYKKTLNASESIINVKQRKQQEQEEKDRIKAQEDLKRKNNLISLGMQYDEMTKSFVYNDDIYISENVAFELDKSEFLTKFIELQEKIKADKKENEPTKETTTSAKNEPVQTEIKEVLKAPKVEENTEIVTARFEAKATYAKLKALGQYMKENNIIYKNL